MKIKYRKEGLLGKIYTVVEPCCEFTRLFKKIRLDEYRGFIAEVPYNNLLVINYCGN